MCATRGEARSHTVLLRNYQSPEVSEVDCTIWEAAQATSAASSFFDPIKIGDYGETFVDGATGCNNPVDLVMSEARKIWRNADQRILSIVSIGTGVPKEAGFGSDLRGIAQTLIAISTETERTEERFHAQWTQQHFSKQQSYFRFNVSGGLEEVGLEEYRGVSKIAAATKVYLGRERIKSVVDACVWSLRSAQSRRRSDRPLLDRNNDMILGTGVDHPGLDGDISYSHPRIANNGTYKSKCRIEIFFAKL